MFFYDTTILEFLKLIFFVKLGCSQGLTIGIRQKPTLNGIQNMARSLPVSVPLPEGLPKRGDILDLLSDEDEEESDMDKGKDKY